MLTLPGYQMTAELHSQTILASTPKTGDSAWLACGFLVESYRRFAFTVFTRV